MASFIENANSEIDNDKQVETFSAIINLNVGGTLFTTRLRTLTSRSDSMLSRMFSGYSIDKDSDGRYFIDRDGKYFSHILNYLRDPSNFVISVDIIPAVLVEAEYYQISGMVELLRGHPSLLTTKVMKRYRDHLGARYTDLKQSVILLLISSKKQTTATNFLSAGFNSTQRCIDPNLQSEMITDDMVSDSQNSSYVPSHPARVENLHGSLQTEVRIATPTVIFEGIEVQNAPTTFTQNATRRNHQRPYNQCLSDGHDFLHIDIVSTYWQKSEIWHLLLHDLRQELNTIVELKMEQHTVYCRRCQYNNPYGVCILSIFWLKSNIPSFCTQESTQYLTTQDSTYSTIS
ncbi:BTB/POZ domain-containing protein KCTD7-like [Oopsacas minuta]|uniref:BTB/POZ domain-containing protein KCTD7-like n=1 Tax=Oopsacas minuta TaxID=111878 RepID=A0AAV7K2J0_9METZ|nr:BTB/POZ domain-containing protein KCTD7-like [Oopsacas minuta]